MKKRLLVITTFLVSVTLWQVTATEQPSVPMRTTSVNTPTFTGQVAWLKATATEGATASLIGVHGTPGSWTAWQKLMKHPTIQTHVDFIAIDRPGWGDTVSTIDRAYPRLDDQADILSAALSQMSLTEPVIVVAHSWGGPVALALAAKYPELIDGLVLIASPASPEASRPRWYHKAAKLGLVKFMIGDAMNRSNLEMLTLDQELTQLASQLTVIHQPTVIMQGKKDWLVTPENAFYLQRMMTNAPVKLIYDLDANHFIPFTQTDNVVDAINWVTEQIGKQAQPAYLMTDQ